MKAHQNKRSPSTCKASESSTNWSAKSRPGMVLWSPNWCLAHWWWIQAYTTTLYAASYAIKFQLMLNIINQDIITLLTMINHHRSVEKTTYLMWLELWTILVRYYCPWKFIPVNLRRGKISLGLQKLKCQPLHDMTNTWVTLE